MPFVLALAYLFVGASVATSYQNVTEPPIISARDFIPHQSRDVWQIVWSCVSTTLACTWVSVHPNAPFFPQSDSAGLVRRLYLMVLSLIMPEFVVSWAIAQNLAAWRVKHEINRIDGAPNLIPAEKILNITPRSIMVDDPCFLCSDGRV